MDTKAKLVELLKNLPQVNHFEAQVQGMDYVFRCAADHLIANGVTIPVRCKDCKNRGNETDCPMCFHELIEIDEGGGYYDSDLIIHDRTIDDGSCDRGERRTDD